VVLAFALLGCSGVAPSASSTAIVPGTAGPTVAAASGTPASSLSPSKGPAASGVSGAQGPFSILPGAKPAEFNPTVSCTGSIGATDPVALVQMHATVPFSGPVVLRDYADPSKPRTVCTFGNTAFAIVQLIDARHMVIASDTGAYAIVDLPAVRFRWFQLPVSPGSDSQLIAVSPALDRVAWKAVRPGGSATDVIHVATTGGDRVVSTLPDTNTGRCSASTDSTPGAYTRSGSALFVLDEPLPEISLLVVKGETVAFSDVSPAGTRAPATRPLFALWSPTSETLYYVQDGDVWRWTPSVGRTRYLTGVSWTSATISPDGAHLAYSIQRSDGLHDIFLVDLLHGGPPVRIGKGPRVGPAFLNSNQLWYMPDNRGGGCTGEAPQAPLVYNLTNGSESPSIIENVRRIWPATSTHA
jgi:hypothetical protein